QDSFDVSLHEYIDITDVKLDIACSASYGGGVALVSALILGASPARSRFRGIARGVAWVLGLMGAPALCCCGVRFLFWAVPAIYEYDQLYLRDQVLLTFSTRLLNGLILGTLVGLLLIESPESVPPNCAGPPPPPSP